VRLACPDLINAIDDSMRVVDVEAAAYEVEARVLDDMPQIPRAAYNEGDADGELPPELQEPTQEEQRKATQHRTDKPEPPAEDAVKLVRQLLFRLSDEVDNETGEHVREGIRRVYPEYVTANGTIEVHRLPPKDLERVRALLKTALGEAEQPTTQGELVGQ
jgi:hypothetical protein